MRDQSVGTRRWRAVLAAAVLAAAPAAAAPPPPWTAQPFAADPRAVVAAAAAATAAERDHGVVLLDEEATFTFDAEGRCDFLYRVVYRLQTEAAVRSWASIETTWAPWYEDRPTMRARVSTPAGEAHVLDQGTVTEAPVSSEDEGIYSDRRRLRAPLPGVVVGAVVEEEFRSVDRLPYFAAGTSYRFNVGAGYPVHRVRVMVDAPESLPLHHVLRGAEGVAVGREAAGGRVRLTLQAGPLAPVPAAEPWMPADRPRGGYFGFSTGRSWAAIAGTYSSIVDTQIGVPPVAEVRRGVRRQEVVARLVKRLHEQVRYTGVELAEASLVPRSPSEVLARRYGDCKDKAALLVAQLRQEGVPAYVALVDSGTGADMDRDLPGLGSFDHAVVVLPGDPELWIDATDDFARVGDLPASVQDRLALVASAGSTALVRTPAAASGASVLRKSREYVMSEAGPGRVVEITRPSGFFERTYRSFYATTQPKELRESQEKYARSEHEADAVVKAEHADPRDFTRPFELRVESSGAQRARVDDTAAVAVISPAGLFARLPDYISAAAEDGGPDGRRRSPFVVTEPHRVEWTYRVVPPPGFAVKTLPEPVTGPVGTASLEIRFTAQRDQSVEGRLVFDTGPRTMTPEGFEALRAAVRTWFDREPLRVEFQLKAQALLDAGRTCEGLSELRGAVEARPKSAAAHERLAEALLAAGFGEAARDQARLAAAAEPSSSSAQRTLGWMLEHDALGRRFKPGSDRVGAEAAYRKARSLDPTNALARSSLAILLEHDGFGVHFGEGARLAEAAAEWQSYRADLKDEAPSVNYMLSLLYLRRFGELEALARALPADQDRNEILIGAVAAQRGVDAALQEASQLFPEPGPRRDGLLHTGNTLAKLRLYEPAAALLNESVQGARDASERLARAGLMSRVRRYDASKLAEDDPRTPVKRLFIVMAEEMAGERPPMALVDVLAATEEGRREILANPAAVRAGLMRAMRSKSASFGRDLVDIALSLGEFAVEGDAEGGYRVRLRSPDASFSYYVVRRDGRLRVLVAQPTEEAMALEAWRLFDAGDAARGWRWLDWIRDSLPDPQGRDPLTQAPFHRLWRPAPSRTVSEGRVAAVTVFRTSREVARGIQVLTAWRDALKDGAARRDVDLALLALYMRAGRDADVLRALESLSAALPESDLAWYLRVSALFDTKRAAEARALIDRRLVERPGDASALRLLADTSARAGRYDEAERAYARMAEAGQSERGDLNNRAWAAVLRGAVDDAATEWARQGAQGAGVSAALHTLATVYAERGRVKEALQVLVQSVAASEDDELRPDDWYVVGRAAEGCGLLSTARAAYARVEPSPDARLDATHVLAVRRLAGLPAAGRAAARQ